MRERRRRWSAWLVGLVLAAALVPVSPAAAAAPITFQHERGTRCVNGAKPIGGTLTVTLRRADGTRRDRRQDTTGGTTWQVCFGVTPRAGDRIRAVQGSIEREVRVPDLTIAIDRVTDVVRGRAPKGRRVTIQATLCFTFCGSPITSTTTADRHGTYRKRLSFDIGGSDVAVASISTSAGDRFRARAYAPWFEVVAPGRAGVGCARGSGHLVTLRRPDGQVRGTATPAAQRCDPDGTLATRRFTRRGTPVDVRVGDIVKSDIASDARFVWPVMSLLPNTDGASGACFREARYTVGVSRMVAGERLFVGTLAEGSTQPDGTFDATVGSPPTVMAGDRIRLICETRRGDRAILDQLVA